MRHFKLSFFFRHRKYIAAVLGALFIASTLISILMIIDSPEDYLQGIFVKIMYIHVPSAQLGLGCYIMLGLFSGLFFVYKNPGYDILCSAIAPIGAIYTFITLVTGAIWGKPTWGTWWVWDARLTSMLILLLIFIAYLSLRNSLHRDDESNAKIAAVFAIFGLVNVPTIKFSVYLWSTLHQTSSIFGYNGISIHKSMLYPLIASGISFAIFTCLLLLININTEILKRKLSRLRNLK
jgi:heme exporter protein C